jgi:hypothetical protein
MLPLVAKVPLPYGGKDPRDMPVCGIVDASRYLRIPGVTLATWIRGRSVTVGDKLAS